MLSLLIIAIGLFLIPGFLLADQSHADSEIQDKAYITNNHNHVRPQLENPPIDSRYREIENPDVQRHFSDPYRKRRTKKPQNSLQLTKTTQKPVKDTYATKSHSRRKKGNRNSSKNRNANIKTFHTYEEIHEHVNETSDQPVDDSQYQASDRFETHQESFTDVDSSDAGNEEHEKKEKHKHIRVRHHHHHHHHNHVKEVIKKVPKPYPVEKIVRVPVEKVIEVEKIVHVPVEKIIEVEKIVHVPVEKIIEKIIHVPKPYHVYKEKVVHIPKPYPVLRTVPYPVEIKVPVAYPVEKKVPYKVEVERKVPIPYRVEVERKVPVYIHSHDPYKFEHVKDRDFVPSEPVKFSHNYEETYDKEHDLAGSPASYNSHKLHQHQFKGPIYTADFEGPPTIHHHYQPKPNQTTSHIEQTTSESNVVPVTTKALADEPIIALQTGPDITGSAATVYNVTSDLQPQASTHDFQGIPLSLPFHFINLQPMAFQSPLSFALPFQSPDGTE